MIMRQAIIQGTQIEARLSHCGKHYYLDTPLALKGHGIVFLDTLTDATNIGTPRFGWHHYKVTEAAFEKLSQQYRIVSESLL